RKVQWCGWSRQPVVGNFRREHQGSRGFRLLGYLPDRIQNSTVDPFDNGARVVDRLRPILLAAADIFPFYLDGLSRSNGKPGALHCVDQILAAWIDSNAAFGGDDIDKFARAGQSCDLVYDDRNAVAEGWDCEDGATGEEAVLPTTDAVKQAAVGVSDHVG